MFGQVDLRVRPEQSSGSLLPKDVYITPWCHTITVTFMNWTRMHACASLKPAKGNAVLLIL